jgi:tetratricopeptide (TPR) repeat protein
MVQLRIVLFFCAIGVLFPSASDAFQRGISEAPVNNNCSINGNIYYGDTGRPADHITVILLNSEGSASAPATTSASGGFEFRPLTLGSYEILIDVQGYERIRIPADITVASLQGLAIYLKPLAEKKPPSKAGAVSAHELSMPQSARDLMLSGKKKLYQDKDAQSGLADFQQAVSLAPDYYEAHYQIALAYLALGKPDDAEKSFHKSINVSGDKYGEADVGLGKVLLDKGDAPDAEKTIRRGIELSSNSSRGFYELGRAQLIENKIADAQKSAEQARSLAPDFAAVYRLLANIHMQQKNYTALLQDIDAYVKLDPDSPAGVRAKQMREQLQEKLAKEKSPSPPASKP